jgi:hypothetical protein
MAAGAQLGLAVSSVIDAIGEAPAAAELGLSPKGGSPMMIPIPGLCPGSGTGGTAILSFDGPPINVGEQVTLTFTDCVGSVFSGRAIDGTLVLTVEAVSGGF